MQLPSCMDTAWWEAAKHKQLTEAFTSEAFRQLFFPWQERSIGRSWAVPSWSSLGTLSLEEGMRCCSRPWNCTVSWLWGLGRTVGKFDHLLEMSRAVHMASYADHFWKHSTQLGGLSASACFHSFLNCCWYFCLFPLILYGTEVTSLDQVP